MKVEQLMTRSVQTCTPNDSLEAAARIMWSADCGVVPVVDAEGAALGMVTDRDVCMAAYAQGKALWEIPVSSACSKTVYAVLPDESIETAETIMRTRRVRRLAVIDEVARVVGILSLDDLARHTGPRAEDVSSDELAQTLASVCRPRAA